MACPASSVRAVRESPARASSRRGWRRWWRPALAIVALLLLLLLVARRPLAEWLWPDTRVQTLLDQADAALARGRLSAGDGSGARELYEAAAAIDPDRGEAREGLARVAQAALVQANRAIASGRHADAHRALQLARALSAPRAQYLPVAQRLRTVEASQAGISQLLRQAAEARAAHRLDGSADAALPLYRKVLALEPERLEALEGREDALADLLQAARQAIAQGALVQAAAQVAAARGYDAGHADLPAAQAELAHALDLARQRADRELRRGRLATAVAGYRELLRIDPHDAAATQGLERAADAYARRAQRFAADFRFADADAALAQARALAPEAPGVVAAGRHLARAHRTQATLAPALSVRTRTRRVTQLLAEAQAAEARGDLLAPPGDSAFDKLRAARALAPDDPAVRRAGARLLPAARSCFERELRGNSLGRARACLDAWVALDGNGSDAVSARRRLAERWLAIGDERLGAGDVAAARHALASARAIDPQLPGIEAFAQRLATASAAD